MAVFECGEFEDGTLHIQYIKHVLWNSQSETASHSYLSRHDVGIPCGRWILSRDRFGADVWEVGTQRHVASLRKPTDNDPGSPTLWGALPLSANYQFSADGRFVIVTGFQTTVTPNLIEMVFTGQWSRINKPETVSVARLWDVERARGGRDVPQLLRS